LGPYEREVYVDGVLPPPIVADAVAAGGTVKKVIFVTA